MTILSIEKVDIDTLKVGLLRYKETLLLIKTYKTYLKALVAFKYSMRKFPNKETSIIFPVAPVPPTAQPAFQTELNDFIIKIVNRIKNNSNYSNTIGDNLGIIGADRNVDIKSLKPVLSGIITGGFVKLKYKKGDMSGVDIYVCRNDDGKFELLVTAMKAQYTDRHPLPTKAEKWQYKAIYRLGDNQVGQMSEVFFITVVAS